MTVAGMIREKCCSACKQPKSLDCFGSSRSKRDGKNIYCVPCAKQKRAAWYQANREKAKAAHLKWCEENKERLSRTQKQWVLKNPEKRKAAVKKYEEVHREKVTSYRRKYQKENIELVAARNKAWRVANPHKVNALAAKHRAKLIERTPIWLTLDDFEIINFFYEWAKVLEASTGIPQHVDHILPLNGKYVSGLHVPSNLQVLPASENQKKSNKWNP